MRASFQICRGAACSRSAVFERSELARLSTYWSARSSLQGEMASFLFAERLLCLNCTAKLQPFQGALMVFGGHWKSLAVIGGYWWKKRAKNLHKSRKFSNFTAWKRCINTNWQKRLEWAQIPSAVGSMRTVVNLHVLVWRDEAKCCLQGRWNGFASNTELTCKSIPPLVGPPSRVGDSLPFVGPQWHSVTALKTPVA